MLRAGNKVLGLVLEEKFTTQQSEMTNKQRKCNFCMTPFMIKIPQQVYGTVQYVEFMRSQEYDWNCKQIKSNFLALIFCTVGARATFLVGNGITTKRNFQPIWIAMEKSLVKRGDGLAK